MRFPRNVSRYKYKAQQPINKAVAKKQKVKLEELSYQQRIRYWLISSKFVADEKVPVKNLKETLYQNKEDLMLDLSNKLLSKLLNFELAVLERQGLIEKNAYRICIITASSEWRVKN